MIYNPKNNPFINELNLIENEIHHQQIIKMPSTQPEKKVKTAKEMMEEFFKTNNEEN